MSEDKKLTKEQLEWFDKQIYRNDHSIPALDFFRSQLPKEYQPYPNVSIDCNDPKYKIKNQDLKKCFEKLVKYLNKIQLYKYLKRKWF